VLIRIGGLVVLIVAAIVVAGCASRSAAGGALTLEGRQWAYDRGYSDGVERGQNDLRNGLPFDPKRDEAYEEGDRGYRRPFRSRDTYREVYRQAYEAGYKRGYYGYK